VRNEADIVEAFIRHTLAFVDQIVILDHASTDDTNGIVKALRDEGLPLMLLSDSTVGYWQSPRMTMLMREVAVRQCEAEWVLPLDADEFIAERQAGCLRRVLAESSGPVHLRWTTYAPRRTDDPNDANPATRIRFRASEESTWYKVIVPRQLAAHEFAALTTGNHEVEIDGVASVALPTRDVWLAHFPVRSGAQFAGKVSIKQLQRLAMHNRHPGWGYHMKRFYDLLKTDPDQFYDSYCDAALAYAPRETCSESPTAIEEPLHYAGAALRYTSTSHPVFQQTLLPYAERLAGVRGHVRRTRSTDDRGRRTRARMPPVKGVGNQTSPQRTTASGDCRRLEGTRSFGRAGTSEHKTGTGIHRRVGSTGTVALARPHSACPFRGCSTPVQDAATRSRQTSSGRSE